MRRFDIGGISEGYRTAPHTKIDRKGSARDMIDRYFNELKPEPRMEREEAPQFLGSSRKTRDIKRAMDDIKFFLMQIKHNARTMLERGTRNGSAKKLFAGSTEYLRSPSKRSVVVPSQVEDKKHALEDLIQTTRRKTERVKQELEQLFSKSPSKMRSEP